MTIAPDAAFRDYCQSLEAKPPAPGQLAFFDLDRTLVAGYSFHAFVYERARRGHVSSRGLLRQVRQMLEYGTQRIGFTELLERVAADLDGLAVDDAQALAERVFDKHLKASIYREARELVALHRRLGHRLVMVTSATRFQAQPVADFLGFDDVCCTELGVRDGHFNGRLRGAPCFGDGKANAGRRMARRYRQRLADACFYSDSADDLPLFDSVGHPVAVNAQVELATVAADRGWPSLVFSSRRAANLAGAVRSGMLCQGLVSAAFAGAATYAKTLSPKEARNRMVAMLGDLGTLYAGMDLEVTGEAFLEAVRPAVFIFNHQSYLDGVILARLLRHDVTAFCKKELAQNPLIGPFMRANGAIFVDRENPHAARAQLQSAAGALKEGRSVAIAPEGTRSMDDQLAPFKHGAFVLARKTGVPVVPVVLHNSGDALPRGKLCINPTTVRVTVLPPTALHDCSRQEFNDRIARLEQQYRETIAAVA